MGVGEGYRQARTVRYGIGMFFLTVVALHQSWGELKYALFGETIDALVQRSYEDRRERQHITYRFEYDNGRYKGTSRLPHDAPAFEPGDTVEVVFLPKHPKRSKPVIARSMFYPTVLGVLTLTLGFILLRIFLDARRGVFG